MLFADRDLASADADDGARVRSQVCDDSVSTSSGPHRSHLSVAHRRRPAVGRVMVELLVLLSRSSRRLIRFSLSCLLAD